MIEVQSMSPRGPNPIEVVSVDTAELVVVGSEEDVLESAVEVGELKYDVRAGIVESNSLS